MNIFLKAVVFSVVFFPYCNYCLGYSSNPKHLESQCKIRMIYFGVDVGLMTGIRKIKNNESLQ